MYGVQTLTINKVNSYDGSTIDGGLIWGDGPEGLSAALLDTAAYGRALTNVKLTAGKTYEAEYYLHNRTGTNVIMAICVKNTSTFVGADIITWTAIPSPVRLPPILLV